MQKHGLQFTSRNKGGRRVSKFVHCLGLAWGVTYFVAGMLSSFNINNVHFCASWVVLLLTFLTPLPAAIVAFKHLREAGMLLITCAAICCIILIYIFGFQQGITTRSASIYAPHLIFGLYYSTTAFARARQPA